MENRHILESTGKGRGRQDLSVQNRKRMEASACPEIHALSIAAVVGAGAAEGA